MTVESRFNTTAQMRDSVFFDGPTIKARLSRFWLLLVLSAVIASAGVVADSTATVIGAMIVAPLMTPILGTMLATVLGDHANLVRSLLLVVAGAATAIAVGYIVGLFVVAYVTSLTNPQVASRVSPRLIDLLAALGTGVVGSIALVRRDISDTLPGVAIAISLVPPLAVVGLTLESGALRDSLGALVLFLTNVVAIIGTGIAVMSFYGVTRISRIDDAGRARSLRRPVALMAAMFVLIGIPLGVSTVNAASGALREQNVLSVAEQWAESVDWQVAGISSKEGETTLRLEGAEPLPDADELSVLLEDAGIDADRVTVNLIPIYSIELE
jgi:uncharacterized hydrophobic protein (TIGR00271 family)